MYEADIRDIISTEIGPGPGPILRLMMVWECTGANGDKKPAVDISANMRMHKHANAQALISLPAARF